MKPTFGDLRSKDGTARFERIVQRAAERFNRAFEKASAVLPRQIGSVPVAPEDQLFDYEQERDNPQAMTALRQKHMQARGPMVGTLAFVNYVLDMERKRLARNGR